MGTPFDAWQSMVTRVASELVVDDDTGLLIPRYREVIVSVPRQAGKTTWTAAWMADRCVTWQRPGSQRVLYSAQSGQDARKKLIIDLAPMWQNSELHKPLLLKVLGGIGAEGVIWKSGSRIDILGGDVASGHGRTLDLAVVDESFSDVDSRREQAIVPAQSTRRDAQVVNVSTAGTAQSVFLWRKVVIGRAAVDAGRTEGVAYFEWSAPADCDPYDEAVWYEFHPALASGRIGIEALRNAATTMQEGEFRRAYLNQWTEADEKLFPDAVWRDVSRAGLAQDDSVVFAVEVAPDRDHASVVACDATNRVVLVADRPGVDWCVARIVEVCSWGGAPCVIDAGGPAGSLIPDLRAAGVDVIELGTRDVTQASAALYDDVLARRVTFRSGPEFDGAVAHATKRRIGDAWVFARRTAVNSMPTTSLMAAALASWGAIRARKPVNPVTVQSLT